jgi:hypothetical protein
VFTQGSARAVDQNFTPSREERMPMKVRTLQALCLLPTLLALDACYGRGPFEVTLTFGRARSSRSYYSSVGRDLLDTVAAPGAGVSYSSPPSLSGSSVEYVGVSCAVPTSSTCDQVFHFRATATGQTVVTFRGTGGSEDLVDTVIVR